MLSHEIIKTPVPKAHYNRAKMELIEGLKPGDWTYYHYAGAPNIVNSAQCSVVVEVHEDNPNITAIGERRPYLLMSLTATSSSARSPDYKFQTDPWVRWSDATNIAKVPEERKQELNDDFVSNYIETHLPQARRYLK